LGQGSEFGFGKMYATGINDEAITPKDRFIHIVSCNVHNIAVAIKCVAMQDGNDFVRGRFVCMRRANDISQDSGFVASPKVSEHNDKDGRGTHHARDVWHLYNTLGYDLDVFSSAIKINTQYMHSIWYDIVVKNDTTKEEVEERFRKNPRVAVTYKKLANLVFSFGRDHGHYGRLLNQTVVVLPTLHVKDGKEVIGFCFTPQDGNPLLSSVSAMERFLYPESYQEKLKVLSPLLFDEV
jgi:glyceraldehyde-3-phosphate dehydrogenase (NAD(P))